VERLDKGGQGPTSGCCAIEEEEEEEEEEEVWSGRMTVNDELEKNVVGYDCDIF
jgi:hypothetical protein